MYWQPAVGEHVWQLPEGQWSACAGRGLLCAGGRSPDHLSSMGRLEMQGCHTKVHYVLA